MIIILFVYLFLNKQTNSYLIKNVNFNNLNEGSDNRILNNITDINYNTFYRMKLHMKKQHMLNVLEDNDLRIHYKLHMLENSKYNKDNIKPPNILEGGLMKHFEF